MKLLALVLLAQMARADESESPKLVAVTPKAQALYEIGISHFLAKNYAAAADELGAAQKAEPHREILFAWAQAERMRGNCPVAIDLYRKYLADNRDSKLAPVVQGHIRGCEQVARPPWYKDALGDVATLSGIASLAVGVGFLVPSVSNETARNAALTESDFNQFQSSARTQRIVAITCLTAGGVLVALGIVRYVVRGRHQ